MIGRRRLPAFGSAFLSLLAVSCAGAGASAVDIPFPSGAHPNVLLITVDTLRPDALGWVAHRNATPEIDALAGAGFRFPAAVSPVPLTLPSHTSILSGWLPRHHGVRSNGEAVPADVPLLAARLAKEGYTTGAFVSGYPLRAEFGLDRGFDVYDDRLPAGREGWSERSAEATVEAAAAWVAQVKAPWFLWVHFYDPHDPYDPPRAFSRSTARGRYEGEVAYVDSAIGKLERTFRGRGETVLTVLTADHGEAFEEHGESGHGFFIYDTTILVPMVISWPGRILPGESVAPARLIDVTPTVLDLVGLPEDPAADGTSLRPLFTSPGRSWPGAYLESLEPWTSFGWSPLTAWRQDGWKLIHAPKNELYDLRTDAGETVNRIGGDRRRASAMAQAISTVERASPRTAVATGDPQAAETLRSLGYLGGGTGRGEAPAGLADPKDRIAQRDELVDGETLLKAGRPQEAISHFDRVLATDADNRFANERLAVAWLMANKPERAIPLLERAAKLDPGQAEVHYALADAYVRVGRLADSLPHWLETVRLQPRRAAAWSNLGVTLGNLGRLADAVAALRRAVAADPRDSSLHGNLGTALLVSAAAEASAGRSAAARVMLAEGLAEDPSLASAAAADPQLGPLLQP